MITLNHGWKCSIKEFLQLSLHDFIQTLTSYVYGSLSSQQWLDEQEKIQSQQNAWKDCFEKLQQIFHNYNTLDGWLIFEYSILRGSGRRPDVLLLLPGHVLVIECKSYNAVSAAEYLQTSLYVLDIEHYHSAVQQHSLNVTGVLLLTNHTSDTLLPKNEFHVYLASQNSLHKLINGLIKRSENNTITADQFLDGTYQPSILYAGGSTRQFLVAYYVHRMELLEHVLARYLLNLKSSYKALVCFQLYIINIEQRILFNRIRCSICITK